jgi:RHS repeat-associated protein
MSMITTSLGTDSLSVQCESLRSHVRQTHRPPRMRSLALPALCALAALWTSPPVLGQTYLPSAKIGQPALIATSVPDSSSGYSTSTTHAPTWPSGTPTQNEIVELSRALGGNIDEIYDFVRNYVDTVFIFGAQKGAIGAITDKSGTPFDQAELMVTLAQQAGYTANYQFGTITLTGAQFATWTNITTAQAACSLLANGGIPASINGSSSTILCSSLSATASVTSVTMYHVWVQVNIPGSTCGSNCIFDPSYKQYNFVPQISSLASAAGLTTGQALAAATGSGYTTGTVGSGASAVTYVKGLTAPILSEAMCGGSTSGLAAQLCTYAANLQSYIQNPQNTTTDGPLTTPGPLLSAKIIDLVGGREILRCTPAINCVEPVRQSSLPYSSTVTRTWSGNPTTGGVPDQFRASISISLTRANTSGTWTTVVNNVKVFPDDIYGRKLIYESNFIQNGSNPFVGSLEIVDEFGDTPTVLATTSISGDNPGYSVGTLTVTVQHPYLADDAGSTNLTRTYMNATVTRYVRYATPFMIVHGWGETNRGLVDKWAQRPDEKFVGPDMPNACDTTCTEGHHATKGDGRREQLAALWLMQASKAARLHASIANSIYTHHHTIGIVSADTEVTDINYGDAQNPNLYYSVSDSFDRIDADTGFSVTSTTSNASDRRVAIQAIAATTEQLEGSVAAQQVDLPDTTSTATRFEWGNAPVLGEDPPGSNTTYGPRAFYDFNGGGVQGTAGNYTQLTSPSNFFLVEDQTSTTQNGEHGSGEPTIGTFELSGRQSSVAGVIYNYVNAGFDVIASQEAFLGPGQRGGAYMKQPDGLYLHRESKQRGGALVATLYNSNGDPVQIAHVAVNLNYDTTTAGIKGGGGGTQPDQQSNYDPAMAADVLKAQFVDRSKVLGVDLQTGVPTWTSPAVLEVGAGKFPYTLSANLIWRGGMQQDQTFDEQSHIAPNTPWTTNWNNSLSISGSALEAMGDTDIRASAATVATFLAMQDIYRSPRSPQRDVAAILAGAWWTHQISGNVASASLGTDTRQFLRKYDGTWFLPGAGSYASLTQTNLRAKYVQPNCALGPVSYVLTRGWDYSQVSYVVTNTNGDQQHFGFWGNTYNDGAGYCAFQHGFRMSSWTFPYGMAINFGYQTNSVGMDELYTVSNTLGRTIHFTTSGFAGFDNALSGSDARSVGISINPNGVVFGPITDTTADPDGYTTTINREIVGYRNRLDNVLTADNATVPSLKYTYDSLNRVNAAYDAVALRQATRGPYYFYLGEGARGERMDPAGGQYTVIYDIYRRPLQYIDELSNATSVMHDGRGRVTSYTYPEGNQQVLGYDDHNNTTSLQRIAKLGSGLTFAPIQAQWNQTWNKPSSITDSMGCLTTLNYVLSGNGTSLLQNATRCKPDSTQSNPLYQFTYNAYGQTLTTTDPTSLATVNTYDTLSNNSNLLTTTLDPTGVDAITHYTDDANGNVSTVTDARGYLTQNQYDNDRRKTFSYHYNGAVTTSLLAAEQTVYDALGRDHIDEVASAVSGTSVTTWQTTKTTVYTDDSKVQTVQDGAGDTTTHAYDKMDRENLVTDPVGRMVGTVYDLAGHPLCIWHAWNSTTAPSACTTPSPSTYNGSSAFQYAAYTYSGNGNRLSELDANNNLTTMIYDGVDRLSQLIFPLPTEASGHSDTTDYEAYGYDSNDNRLSFKTRDGYTFAYAYDALNRKTVKSVPAGAQSAAYTVYYGYDLAGRPTCSHFGSTSGLGNVVCTTGTGIDYGYDTLKRITSETNSLSSPSRALTYQFDLSSNRTKLTWPDGNYLNYDFDGLNRVYQIRENGATSGVGVLVGYGYDPESRLTNVMRGNGTSSTLQYDPASRLYTLGHTLPSQSEALTFLYTPASQLQTRTSSNASYDYAPTEGSRAYTANGLNEYASVGGITYSNDGRGNLQSDGTRTLTYDLENHLLSLAGGAGLTLQYDPLGRIWQTTSGSTVTQFLYDGDRLVGEYSSSGTVLQRYAHGPRADNPVVWYEGSAMTTREWIHADERGSVIATTDSTGTPTIYTYGSNGEPLPSWTGSRFRYTGQIALPEAQLYDYKARVYDPGVGRFFQTDPAGTKDDLNLYAYVYNDPTDRTDPTGLEAATAEWLQQARALDAETPLSPRDAKIVLGVYTMTFAAPLLVSEAGGAALAKGAEATVTALTRMANPRAYVVAWELFSSGEARLAEQLAVKGREVLEIAEKAGAIERKIGGPIEAIARKIAADAARLPMNIGSAAAAALGAAGSGNSNSAQASTKATDSVGTGTRLSSGCDIIASCKSAGGIEAVNP